MNEAEYEITELTLENIPYIAQRSGKDDQELRAMLMVQDMKGKQISVRYRVVAPAPEPVKKSRWRRKK